MRLRIIFARFLIRLGRFIQSLAIMVMRPDDLVEFSRLSYVGPERARCWGREGIIERGLDSAELALLDRIPLKKGKLLVLGVGGGREAIFFARLGYDVTGLDFVKEMVEKSKENAIKRGLEIEGMVQEISRINIPANSYDIIWLSKAMYSCIPTKTRRIEMLKKIKMALKPGGYFACQFVWGTRDNSFSKKVELMRKLFSFITLGNLSYEGGDVLWANQEFIHIFLSEDRLRSEFKDAGFTIEYINLNKDVARGEALLTVKEFK